MKSKKTNPKPQTSSPVPKWKPDPSNPARFTRFCSISPTRASNFISVLETLSGEPLADALPGIAAVDAAFYLNPGGVLIAFDPRTPDGFHSLMRNAEHGYADLNTFIMPVPDAIRASVADIPAPAAPFFFGLDPDQIEQLDSATDALHEHLGLPLDDKRFGFIAFHPGDQWEFVLINSINRRRYPEHYVL